MVMVNSLSGLCTTFFLFSDTSAGRRVRQMVSQDPSWGRTKEIRQRDETRQGTIVFMCWFNPRSIVVPLVKTIAILTPSAEHITSSHRDLVLQAESCQKKTSVQSVSRQPIWPNQKHKSRGQRCKTRQRIHVHAISEPVSSPMTSVIVAFLQRRSTPFTSCTDHTNVHHLLTSPNKLSRELQYQTPRWGQRF